MSLLSQISQDINRKRVKTTAADVCQNSYPHLRFYPLLSSIVEKKFTLCSNGEF